MACMFTKSHLDGWRGYWDLSTSGNCCILADAGVIYTQKTEGDIRAQAEVFRETWQEREPKAVANFFTDFDKTLAYLRVDFPASLGILIRTTNRLERFHKEMRRKQRDIAHSIEFSGKPMGRRCCE